MKSMVFRFSLPVFVGCILSSVGLINAITAGSLDLTTPELIEPINWATIVSLNPTFRWKAVEGAASYHIQISSENSFDQIIIEQDSITQTQFTTNVLEAGTTYFWHVRAISVSDTSSWSSLNRFRIKGINIVDRLVAYYLLNGSPEDSVSISDGTLMGDVTLAPDRFGNPDLAYSFDGNDDYIVFSETEAFTSIDRQITVSAWIHPRSLAPETGVMLRDRFWRLFLYGDGSVVGNIFNETETERRIGSSKKASLDTWSLVAFTYDGQNINVYLNGEHSGELEYPISRIGWEGALSTPMLGRGFGNSQNDFNGAIDEVRLYDRALTTEEMTELYRFIPSRVAPLDDENIPTEYLLQQNYPNPFNPSTTISYQLPQPGKVKISIFNVAGQLVETLLDEHKKAGYHSVIWYANGIGSGLYFYRIKAGDYSAVKKIMVMK